jgi:hypothetical protein
VKIKPQWVVTPGKQTKKQANELETCVFYTNYISFFNTRIHDPLSRLSAYKQASNLTFSHQNTQ